MTQPFYVEYQTISTNSPAELDRRVNELLGKETRRGGYSGIFRWTMYGPLSVCSCISQSSTHYVTYTQVMGLCFYRELTEVEWQADLMKTQQRSVLEKELDDPILSFINS